MEASALHLGIPLGDLLHSCGLAGRPVNISTWLKLSTTEIDVVAEVSGHTPEDIAAMTTPIDLLEQTTTAHQPWRRRMASRYCPQCLAETGGRWQLNWRSTWSFSCPTHHCILLDDCPSCGTPQRQRLSATRLIPEPAQCRHTVHTPGHARTCRTPLGTALAVRLSGEDVTGAQHTVNELRQQHPVELALYTDRPVDVLRDIAWLAQRIPVTSPGPLEQWLPSEVVTALAELATGSKRLPASRRRESRIAPPALNVAAGVTAAIAVLSLPRQVDAVAVLVELMAAGGTAPYSVIPARPNEASPVLLNLYGRAYETVRRRARFHNHWVRKSAVARAPEVNGWRRNAR